MRNSWKTFSFYLLLPFLLTPSLVNADINLKFGLYESDKATEMVKMFRPVLNEIEKSMTKELNEPVKIKLQVSTDYEEGVKWIVDGKVDVMQIGPASYTLAKEQSPGIKILAIESEKGTKTFNGVIVVKSDSPIKDVGELKGKSFAFGDKYSTIGRYLSQKILMEKGITSKELSRMEYLERHDKVGTAVGAGQFDAGALKEGAFKKLTVAGTPIRVIHSFPNVTKPWIARSGMDAKVAEAFSKALINFNNKQALEALGQDGFLPGSDEDYEITRQAVIENPKFGG